MGAGVMSFMTWKRLHTLPKRYYRYERQGTMADVFFLPETGQQRQIREQSLARYMKRQDAYKPRVYKGEFGIVDGFRIIESPSL